MAFHARTMIKLRNGHSKTLFDMMNERLVNPNLQIPAGFGFLREKGLFTEVHLLLPRSQTSLESYLEIELDDGAKLICSQNQEFVTFSQEIIKAKDLKPEIDLLTRSFLGEKQKINIRKLEIKGYRIDLMDISPVRYRAFQLEFGLFAFR